jgi:HEAT repeat protein
VARRLPVELLPVLADDADLQVRLQVAQRVEMPALWRMAQDRAPEVRRVAAERVPTGLLPSLAHDSDWLVRWHVASRAGVDLLRKLVDDEDSEVRERARERLETLEGAHHG